MKFTGNAEWYTPEPYLDRVRAVLGEIDLDPASCALANERVKAKRYFTAAQDGLAQCWSGRVYLNPPYSRGVIDRFVGKLLQHRYYGDIAEYITLTNVSVDTRWAQLLMLYSERVCFVRGRISFDTASGACKGKPPVGQMFCYGGSRPGSFSEVFGKIGVIVKGA